MSAPVRRWYQDYRLTWIAETLRVFGHINRGHLMRKFGISKPQASYDLGLFDRTYPGNMVYDKSLKCYRAVPGSSVTR